MRSLSLRRLGLALLGIGLATAPGAALATTMTATSYGADGIFTLGVGSCSSLGCYSNPNTVGPTSNANGTAPSPYNVTDPKTQPSLTQTIQLATGKLGITLGTASTNTSATSDVTSSSTSGTTSATSTITGPNTIQITFTPTGGSMETLFETTLNVSFMSSASVTGGDGSFSDSGSASVSVSGSLDIWGTLFPSTWTISGSIAPNTSYPTSSALVQLVLNEQTGSCPPGGSACDINVNALHLTIDDPTGQLFGTPLYTDLIVGQSYAAQTATVPEPALGLLLLGALVAVAAARRRSARAA